MEVLVVILTIVFGVLLLLAIIGFILLAYRLRTGESLSERSSLFEWASTNILVPLASFFWMGTIMYAGAFYLLGDLFSEETRKGISTIIATLLCILNFGAYYYAVEYFELKKEKQKKNGDKY